jgi:phosphinothricin acetyltransferase
MERETLPEILPMEAADWDAVRAIYEEGIATGNATFEKSAPDWEKWDRAHLPYCRLVARAAGEVSAWAALTPVSGWD